MSKVFSQICKQTCDFLTRDKVKVTRFDVQGLSHQLTGMGIEVEVEVHFVDIFRHLWYIFIKQI